MDSTEIVIIGEALVDVISTEAEKALEECSTFSRQAGGSSANVARFLARTGRPVHLFAAVGDDGFGRFLLSGLKREGVYTSGIRISPDKPTSIVVVNKTAATPEHIAFHAAHAQLPLEDLDQSILDRALLLHSNAFSLAYEPLRTSVVNSLEGAARNGIPVSFDPNWREKIWPDRETARGFIKRLASISTWMKPSLDDARELFGNADPEALARRYLDWGAENIVLTMGAEGALVVKAGLCHHIPARGRLRCATGAGDAFWAVFLARVLDGDDPVTAADFASRNVVNLLEGRTVDPR